MARIVARELMHSTGDQTRYCNPHPHCLMTTAAIYARFSTDRQDATSIADQIRVCRTRAEAIGLDILGESSDAAVSGAIAVLDRPGAGAMHAAALAGKFDVLLVESLDRLSRDLVDSEASCAASSTEDCELSAHCWHHRCTRR